MHPPKLRRPAIPRLINARHRPRPLRPRIPPYARRNDNRLLLGLSIRLALLRRRLPGAREAEREGPALLLVVGEEVVLGLVGAGV